MKFHWQYQYVPEGQTEPDEFGRWALACYLLVPITALPQYEWLKTLGQTNVQIRIATITQKNTRGGIVPSLIDKYAACIPSMHDPANLGLSDTYLYAKDDTELETLKTKIEQEFLKIKHILNNTI